MARRSSPTAKRAHGRAAATGGAAANQPSPQRQQRAAAHGGDRADSISSLSMSDGEFREQLRRNARSLDPPARRRRQAVGRLTAAVRNRQQRQAQGVGPDGIASDGFATSDVPERRRRIPPVRPETRCPRGTAAADDRQPSVQQTSRPPRPVSSSSSSTWDSDDDSDDSFSGPRPHWLPRDAAARDVVPAATTEPSRLLMQRRVTEASARAGCVWCEASKRYVTLTHPVAPEEDELLLVPSAQRLVRRSLLPAHVYAVRLAERSAVEVPRALWRPGTVEGEDVCVAGPSDVTRALALRRQRPHARAASRFSSPAFEPAVLAPTWDVAVPAGADPNQELLLWRGVPPQPASRLVATATDESANADRDEEDDAAAHVQLLSLVSPGTGSVMSFTLGDNGAPLPIAGQPCVRLCREPGIRGVAPHPRGGMLVAAGARVLWFQDAAMGTTRDPLVLTLASLGNATAVSTMRGGFAVQMQERGTLVLLDDSLAATRVPNVFATALCEPHPERPHYLAVGRRNGRIGLLDLRTATAAADPRKPLQFFGSLGNVVHQIAPAGDAGGNQWVARSADGAIAVFDVRRGMRPLSGGSKPQSPKALEPVVRVCDPVPFGFMRLAAKPGSFVSYGTGHYGPCVAFSGALDTLVVKSVLTGETVAATPVAGCTLGAQIAAPGGAGAAVGALPASLVVFNHGHLQVLQPSSPVDGLA